ncbi:MAG TPA: phytoene desaturase family protein [Beijerinckiaceae bacterium]|jgi:phytoene desaturase
MASLSDSHVAVVGAGPGGLAAALLLAAQGLRVTVFEKDEAVGGRTKTVTAPGGYRFDIGPTFFLYPQVLAEIFQACGERLEDHVELRKLDPQYHLIFEGGGEIRATPDVARLEAEIAKIAPADALNVHRFLADNRKKLKVFGPVLQQAFTRPQDIASQAMIQALPYLRPHATVDRDLKRYFADPRVRLTFSFQTKYLGMSPFQCPSLFTILSFLEYEHGVFHPMGGCGVVSEAMAALAQRMGVTFRLGQPVDQILYEGGRAVGLVAGGERHQMDAVVINGDFGHAARRLIPEAHRPRWTDTKLDRARLSCSTFMLYLGLEGGVPESLEHHTILLARDYERNIREITEGILPREPSIYVQNAGVTDPSMAPKGHTSLYVLVPVPNLRAGIDWTVEAPRYRALALKRLEALGLHNLESRIRYERIVTPSDWQDEFAVNEGATFNLAHDLRQMLYFRPHNRFGPGVYLVGGGTHPGSGLPVIYEGARITTRLLLEDLAQAAAPRRWPRPARVPVAEARP